MSASRVIAIMPVYNEARHLPIVLESLRCQTFDERRLYIVAVDGESSDSSRRILEQWFAQNRRAGCVVRNPHRKIPVSLNIGLRYAAGGDIVIRLDAHTVYGPTYIADAVAALESAPADVACVGGSQRPLDGATFQARVVQALYTNPMGLGGADFRTGSGVREADSVYLGAWRAQVVLTAGGFNESMEANEDAELAARLRKKGLRILRVPLPSWFIVNRGVWASLRQWNRYGFWRAKMLRRHQDAVRLRHVAICAAPVCAAALAFSPLRWMLVAAAAAYAVAVFALRARSESVAVTLATILFFPLVHLVFAAGMFAGLLTAAAPDWPGETPKPPVAMTSKSA